jgi:hypothetical protein
MRNRRRFRIPVLRSAPFRGSGQLRAARHARRATGKLTALWVGAPSGRPARGSSQALATGPRARWPTRSSRAWRRSDGRRRGRCGARPIPAGLGECCRNSPKAAAGPCRRPRTAGHAASPAARGRCPSCAGMASCPPQLTLPRVFAACLPAGPQIAGSVFLRVSCGAILLPVMAGGAWRGNSAAYVGAFYGSEEGGCWAPFQGCAETGYRASKMCLKQLYVLTVRGLYIN